MKILHVSAVGNWGGGENHIENLCLEMVEFNAAIRHIILCQKGSMFDKRLKTLNIPFFTAPLLTKFDPRYLYKLISICKKEKIDIIHIHDTTAITLTVMADYLNDLPPFIFSKKTSFPIKKRNRSLYKYNYPKIKKILCVSNETKRITAESIEDLSKLKTVYHGLNIEKNIKPVSLNLKSELNLQNDTLIIGNIANHIKAKDLETFIEVAVILIKKQHHKNLHFVQVGAFTNRTQELKSLVQKHEMQEHISFLNFIPNASNVIPQFALTLITSQSEGIPQVIYESFFHEVPVVSTNVGGIPEIIEHNINGLLCDAHDVTNLASQTLSLLQNKELQNTFTQNSKAKLLNGFTSGKTAEETYFEYKKIIDGRT